MLGYVLDEIFGAAADGHRAPDGHPERPARADAVREALVAAGILTHGTAVPLRLATDDELARVHAASYLDELAHQLPGKSGWIDPDTYFSPGTWRTARLAAGATCQLTADVLDGVYPRGLAVVRPPGHHATRERAMGFCMLNNVAAAAATARARGAARVAIVDWDVHHGNGTQDIFWDDPTVLYASVHQYPFYPGGGAPTEVGGTGARGSTINVGLPAGCGDAEYLAVFDHVIVPALERFAPDLVLVSAGFDAYEHDPLASMRVTTAGFQRLAGRLRDAADRICGGRLVAVLEGGYDLHGLAGGMTGLLAELVRGPAPGPTLAPMPTHPVARAAIEGTLAAHAAIEPAGAARVAVPR